MTGVRTRSRRRHLLLLLLLIGLSCTPRFALAIDHYLCTNSAPTNECYSHGCGSLNAKGRCTDWCTEVKSYDTAAACTVEYARYGYDCAWQYPGCYGRPTTCRGILTVTSCTDSQTLFGLTCAWNGTACTRSCPTVADQATCDGGNLDCLWMNAQCLPRPLSCAGVVDATACGSASATLGFACVWNGTTCQPPSSCSQIAHQAPCDVSALSCAWDTDVCIDRPTQCSAIASLSNAATKCTSAQTAWGLNCLWHDGSAQCLNATSVACSTFTTMTTGATLCPTANTLNPAINCSWSSLAGQCVTRPTSCDTAPVEDLCTEQSACLWDAQDGQCRTPTRCGEVFREDLCATSPFDCYWAAGTCLPIPTTCDEIAQSGICDASPLNCSWSPTASQCVPRPTSCSAAPVQDLCDGQRIAGIACEWGEGGACRAVPASCAQIATQPRCGAHANMSCIWMGDACYPTPTSCADLSGSRAACLEAYVTHAWPCAWNAVGRACAVPVSCHQIANAPTCTSANATLGFPCVWRTNETVAPCEPSTLSAVCGQFTNESTCSNATHRGCQWSSAEGVDACTVRATVVKVDKEEEKSDSVDDVVVIVGAVAGASVGVGALAAIGVWAWKARAVAQAARASGEAAALVRGRAARIKAAAPPKRPPHRVSLV